MASALGEAPSSSPPSCASATPRSWTYHVFVSFRGQDTRKGFTDHLYASLQRKGITTFRDDKDLERGEVISQELVKAIEESMFAVIVLSPNYASSTWCLDELQKIVECSNNLGLSVVPVFFGEEPCNVRHQTGGFEGAFRKHEERFGQDSEKVKRWRDALTQAASYSGWNSKDQHEARLVESITEHVHKKLTQKLPSCTENHIGIASRVEGVISLIGIGLNDVRFVGIWGMGGVGKTTIARAVYEAIQGEFKACCFVRNVRELSEKNGSVHLQKGLLFCLNIDHGKFHDIEDGKKIIKTSLCNKKVLIVLDDVNEVKQLENLAAKQDWFGQGSRIIITTRDRHLLNGHGVHGAYEVKGLDQEEASHLFCLKAFGQLKPKEGYSDLSKDMAKYTKGLPLAVEVLGSYLCGRNVDFWHSTIRETRSGPHFEILKVLKISYDHLMPIEKNIFLDIACFFKGVNKDEVTHILKMCEFYVGIGSEIQSGIVTLIEKSLVTLDRDNKLEMHDLLQEMGRHIVYEESPNNPGKRSRLWARNDIDQVLKNDMGTEAIQGIAIRSSYDAHESSWSTKAFSKTSQLKFLIILPPIRLPLGLSHLPRSLKVLHWEFCPLQTLPLTDEPYEVVEIKLQHSDIQQLWHGRKFLEKLKYLDLSYSWYLKQTPDLNGVPHLETLLVRYCYRLTKVHPSLVQHKNLVLLNLSSCERLETLPGKLEMSSLKELVFGGNQRFENPPEFGECMKNLSRLTLSYTAIRKLPISLGCLVGLEALNIEGCGELDCLPDNIHRLVSLKTLNASWCYNFHTLPTSIHKLHKLGCLKLNDCSKLQSLPELPPSIRELEACNCSSLNSSESSILPVVYGVFKPPTARDRGQVF